MPYTGIWVFCVLVCPILYWYLVLAEYLENLRVGQYTTHANDANNGGVCLLLQALLLADASTYLVNAFTITKNVLNI